MELALELKVLNMVFSQRSDLDPLQFLIYVNCLSNASLKPNFILFTEGRPINVFMSQT